MARAPEFTDAEVIAAGKKLYEAGAPVTGYALRQAIGGGNLSRLKQVWDQHIESLGKVQNVPQNVLSVEVAASIDKARRVLDEQLLKIANDINDAAIRAAKKVAEPPVSEQLYAALARIRELEKELADEKIRCAKAEEQMRSLLDALVSKDAEIRELKNPELQDAVAEDEGIDLAEAARAGDGELGNRYFNSVDEGEGIDLAEAVAAAAAGAALQIKE